MGESNRFSPRPENRNILMSNLQHAGPGSYIAGMLGGRWVWCLAMEQCTKDRFWVGYHFKLHTGVILYGTKNFLNISTVSKIRAHLLAWFSFLPIPHFGPLPFSVARPPSFTSLQRVYTEVASLSSLLIVICNVTVPSMARFFTAPLFESLVSVVHCWSEIMGHLSWETQEAAHFRSG